MKKTLKFILISVLISVLAIIATGLWLTALFHISNLWRGDSDNAYLVIAGNAIAKGNYFLRGYFLSQLDPFYSIDMFVNALFIKLFGFRPLIMHIVPIFLYLAFIFTASFYVFDLRNKDKKGGIAFKAGIFLFIVFLIFPSRAFAFWALQEGMHLSAVIVSLTVFLLIDKFIKTRSYLFLISAFFVLTAGFANDNVNIVTCGIPLIALCLFYIFKDYGKNNILAYSLIILSVIAAMLTKEFIFYKIEANGGFTLAPSGLAIAFVRLKYITKNLYFYTNGILNLLGVNLFGKYLFSLKTVIEIFKITGLIIFIYGIISAVKKAKKLKNEDFLDLLLLGGMLFMSFAFLVSQMPVNKASSRYLMPAVAFGLLLAVRNFGFILNGFIDSKGVNVNTVNKDTKKLLLEFAGATMLIVYTGSFILNSAAVIPKSPIRPLGKWLIKHHLTYGYGTYWDAGIVTLETKGKVKIRQLIADGSKIVPYRWLSNKRWYKKKGFFVIYTEHFIWFNRQAIIDAFGKPSKIYVEDFQGTLGRAYGRSSGRGTLAPYVIMVYKNGIVP